MPKKKAKKAKKKTKSEEINIVASLIVDELKPVDTKLTKLRGKQPRFCEEYIIDLNATQAAIRAGYIANSLNAYAVIGCQNLIKLNVQAEIAKLKAERSERTSVKADDVILELAKVAFSNIEDFLEVIEGGEVTLKAFEAIEREKLAAIESIKISTTTNKEDSREYTTTQFKLHSKLNALEQLGKHLGIYKKDKVVDVGENLQSFIDWLVGRDGDPEDTSRNRPLLTG